MIMPRIASRKVALDEVREKRTERRESEETEEDGSEEKEGRIR